MQTDGLMWMLTEVQDEVDRWEMLIGFNDFELEIV